MVNNNLLDRIMMIFLHYANKCTDNNLLVSIEFINCPLDRLRVSFCAPGYAPEMLNDIIHVIQTFHYVTFRKPWGLSPTSRLCHKITNITFIIVLL